MKLKALKIAINTYQQIIKNMQKLATLKSVSKCNYPSRLKVDKFVV